MTDPTRSTVKDESRANFVILGTIGSLILLSFLYSWLLLVPESLALRNWSEQTVKLDETPSTTATALYIDDAVIDVSSANCRDGALWGRICVAPILAPNSCIFSKIVAWAVATSRHALTANSKCGGDKQICGINLKVENLNFDLPKYLSLIQKTRVILDIKDASDDAAVILVNKTPTQYKMSCYLSTIRAFVPFFLSLLALSCLVISYCCPACCFPVESSVSKYHPNGRGASTTGGRYVELLPTDVSKTPPNRPQPPV
eukprot:GHVL01032747.1.p1 GENE.GHVL01032747.1~~GHVL01032747.1.p1  ORF type:complete len:258 (+),score=29.29 GHVL01032747.1:105-878(+)